MHKFSGGRLHIPIALFEQLPGRHEVKLRVKLEQLSGDIVPLLLFSLPLLLLLKLLAFFLAQLGRELLVSLLAEHSLPRVFLLQQMVLNISLALEALLVLLDSLLPLRCYLI